MRRTIFTSNVWRFAFVSYRDVFNFKYRSRDDIEFNTIQVRLGPYPRRNKKKIVRLVLTTPGDVDRFVLVMCVQRELFRNTEKLTTEFRSPNTRV